MIKLKCFAALLLSLFLFHVSANAQTTSRSRGAVVFSTGEYWKQDNFNLILNGLNLPSTPSFTLGFGVGTFWRFSNSEIGLEGRFAVGRRSGASDRIMQSSGHFNLDFKQHFNFRSGSFYPLIGVGFTGAKTDVTQRNGPATIAAALTSRNTTTLFNRQGFAVFGLGTRLFEKSQTRGFYTLEAGYRLGFSATPWSTDQESGDYMTNSVTDELRQFYFKLGIGILRNKNGR